MLRNGNPQGAHFCFPPSAQTTPRTTCAARAASRNPALPFFIFRRDGDAPLLPRELVGGEKEGGTLPTSSKAAAAWVRDGMGGGGEATAGRKLWPALPPPSVAGARRAGGGEEKGLFPLPSLVGPLFEKRGGEISSSLGVTTAAKGRPCLPPHLPPFSLSQRLAIFKRALLSYNHTRFRMNDGGATLRRKRSWNTFSCRERIEVGGGKKAFSTFAPPPFFTRPFPLYLDRLLYVRRRRRVVPFS